MSKTNKNYSGSAAIYNTQTYFTIDASTGEITTASIPDRELLVQENLFFPPASSKYKQLIEVVLHCSLK